jgi:hypothetical protein
MRYPVLTRTKCEGLAVQMAAGENPSIEPNVAWVGHGDEIDLRPIAEVADRITRQAREWTDKDRDRFEGKASIEFAEALGQVPPEILDDRGFWRFVALRYFWEFIAWREEGPFSKGNFMKYVHAGTNTESVLPRMFLRARAVGGNPHASLAAAIPKGTDFWRSHVLRVRTGSAPPVTRAFVTKQTEDRLMTDSLRQAARRLNRTWANIILYVYDDANASNLIDSLWNDRDYD